MASFDRKFEIVRPSLDKLTRATLEVADLKLLDPTSITPPALIDGEFVQISSAYKYARALTATNSQPSFAVIEDRGDTGVQASRKLSAVMNGGYEADTMVFDDTGATLGVPLMVSTINHARFGGLDRGGLILHAGGALVIGYVTRLPATNGGRLRFIQTLV